MTTTTEDRMIVAALAPARTLEATDTEVAQVVARSRLNRGVATGSVD